MHVRITRKEENSSLFLLFFDGSHFCLDTVPRERVFFFPLTEVCFIFLKMRETSPSCVRK